MRDKNKNQIQAIIKCKYCGKEKKLPRWLAKIQKYCSSECSQKASKGRKHKPGLKGVNNPLHKKRQLRHNGFQVWDNETLILEHRLIMQNHLKRKLKRSEIIHHIDCNNQNNNLENLFLTNRREHKKIHSSILFLIKDLMKEKMIVFDSNDGKYKLKNTNKRKV